MQQKFLLLAEIKHRAESHMCIFVSIHTIGIYAQILRPLKIYFLF